MIALPQWLVEMRQREDADLWRVDRVIREEWTLYWKSGHEMGRASSRLDVGLAERVAQARQSTGKRRG